MPYDIIEDGHGTLFDFSDVVLTAHMEEQVSRTPGIENGGGKTTTTHRNTTYRTSAGNKLKGIPPTTITVVYAASARSTIEASIGVNQLITITYPDGATEAIWGRIDKFEPGDATTDNQPTAQVTIIWSLRNDAGVETGPVYAAAP